MCTRAYLAILYSLPIAAAPASGVLPSGCTASGTSPALLRMCITSRPYMPSSGWFSRRSYTNCTLKSVARRVSCRSWNSLMHAATCAAQVDVLPWSRTGGSAGRWSTALGSRVTVDRAAAYTASAS